MIIRVHHPDGTTREFPLQAPHELRFGSHPSLEIALSGAGVSKLHGGFVFKEGKPCVVTAKPTEKMTLNGKPVTRAMVKSGDRIRVGDFELEILQPSSAKAKTKGTASRAAAKPQDELGLAAEPDELGLAPEPSAQGAKSEKAQAAQLDAMELLDEASPPAVTEDLEVLDDFEELTEATATNASAMPDSLDVVDELDDVEALDDVEMLAEPAGSAAAADADWLQSGDLLAEEPASAGDLTEGDLFGDVANLPGAGMAGSQTAAAMPAGTAHSSEKKLPAEKQPRVRKKRNYRPLKFIAVTCAGSVVLAAVIAASMFGSTAKDQFSAADALFQNHQWAEADQAFADFQQKYPNSIYLDEARVKRGLIKLLPLIDSQADLQTRLSTVQPIVKELDDLAAHPLVQEQLRKILPPLAKGLGEEALAMPVTAGLEKRGEALSAANMALLMTRQSVSPAEFSDQDLGDLEIRLFLLNREIRETQDMETAAAEIEASIASSQFDSGFAVYERLLDDHAAIAASPVLLNLMQRLSDGLAGKVVFSKDALPPYDGPQRKPIPTWTFAAQETAASAGQPQPVCIFDSPAACVYCLDAGNGALLWRKFIGFDAAFDPQVANSQAGEVILYNAAIGAVEKLDGQTGETVWSQPIGSRKIWLSGGKVSVFVSTTEGDVWELGLGGGELKRKITFPAPPGFAAYVDETGGKLYQPAFAASLFAVALDRDSCDGASFVGHPEEAFRFPPADLGDYLVVVDDAELDRSTLKLIAKKGRGQLIQTIPLDGRVVGGPLAEQNLLLVPTDDGQLRVYGIDDQNSSQPMSLKSNVKWADARIPVGQTTWLKNIGGVVFQAGNGLQVFKRRAGADEYLLTNHLFPGLEMIQPVESVGGLVVLAYRDRQGITVEGLNAQKLTSVWKTRVACSLLEGNRQSLFGEAGNVSVISADLARFPLTKAQLSGTQNVVVNLPASNLSRRSGEPRLICDIGANSQIVAEAGSSNLYLFSPEQLEAHEIKLPNRVSGRLAATSPAAVVPLEDGRIVLIDWKTGAMVGKPAISTPQAVAWVSTCELGDNKFAAANSDGKLQIYQLNQSPPLQIELLTEKMLDQPSAGNFIASGNLLWMASGPRTLLGLDTDSLEQKAAVDLGGSLMFGPQLVDENLVFTTNQEIICVAAASGDQIWRQPLRNQRIVGAATEGGDRLILASAAGDIWSVALTTGEPTSEQFETGQAIRSIHAVAAGTVFLQSVDGSILQLKLTELTSQD